MDKYEQLCKEKAETTKVGKFKSISCVNHWQYILHKKHFLKFRKRYVTFGGDYLCRSITLFGFEICFWFELQELTT